MIIIVVSLVEHLNYMLLFCLLVLFYIVFMAYFISLFLFSN